MRGVVFDDVRLAGRGFVADLLEAERLRRDDVLLRPVRAPDWTVGEVADRARACARELLERGIGQGDRVAIMSRNDPRLVAWLLGIFMAGAVEVEINTELRGPSLRHVVDDASPSLVIASEAGRELLEALGDVDVPIVDLSGAFPPEPVADVQPVVPRPGDLASIVYTSGTTGPSKGVMLSHGYFSNYGVLVARIWDVTPGDVMYHQGQFYHADSHTLLAACLQAGAVFAFPEWFTASGFWDNIAATGATHFSSAGAMLDAIASLEPPPPELARQVRRGGAAPISVAAYEHFERRLGIELFGAYGQTEGLPLFATAGKRPWQSIGWPCAGHDVAVVDADGAELGPGETGELVFRPNHPNLIALGYWRRPEATVEAMRDVWWHSGDAAHVDEDGFFYFDGRITDSLRHRGENVSAWELESTVRQAPGVADVAAVATRDEIGDEDAIKLFVVLEPGAPFEPAALFAYCEENLARFAVPRYIEPIEESAVVRSAGTGAIQKHRLPAEHGPGLVDRSRLRSRS